MRPKLATHEVKGHLESDGATDDAIGERLDSVLRLHGVILSEQDADLRYGFVQNIPEGASPLLGATDAGIAPAALAARLTAAKREAMATGEPRRLEVETSRDGQTAWYEVGIEPRHGVDGAVLGVRTAALDISARKKSEDHLRVLLLELAHRSKNLLAVIQGIANRTAQDSLSVPEFSRRFSGRLHALAQAHDLLTERDWHGAALRALVRSQVLILAGPSAERVDVTGEELSLRPAAAQHVSLALHELTSNALSFGALSSPAGRVAIAWERHAPPADPDGRAGATFVWRECDGPPVAIPERKQFGRVLLEDIVPMAVGGHAELRFAPNGIVYTLDIAGSEVG